MSISPQGGPKLDMDVLAAGQTPPAGPPLARHRRKRSASGGAPVEVAAPEPQTDAEPEIPGRSSDSATIDPALVGPPLEAVLFSTDRPVAIARLVEVLGPSVPGLSGADLKRGVAHLNAAYEREGRSFRIESVSGGLRVMTLPAFADVLARFHGQRSQTRLSRAAIETLAIIAYKQPIARAQVEAIRGVASGDIIKTLMERRLVTITGRAEEVGRPMLYGTTRQFLEVFGLASLRDLPPPEEFGLGAASEA